MRKQGWLWTEEYIWYKKNCYPGKWPNRFGDSWERLLHFTKQRKFKMFQDNVKVSIGGWSKQRLKNLSETDMRKDESKVGSGTTLIAADKLDRYSIGIDINDEYISLM